MPYRVGKSGSGYRVFNKKTGKAYSKKPMSKEKAKKQLAALHIHTNEASDMSLAAKSDSEELKAISDYGERGREASDPDLKAVFKHAREEEKDHDRRFKKWMDESGPRMSEVFKISEMPIPRRPPPGAQPVHDDEWTSNGQMGQSVKQGLAALDATGQHYNPYKTPEGQYVAYPEKDAPGISPMQADMTKGVWTPMTGSSMTGTPFSPKTNLGGT